MLMPIDGTLRRNERYRGNRAGLKKTAPARGAWPYFTGIEAGGNLVVSQFEIWEVFL